MSEAFSGREPVARGLQGGLEFLSRVGFEVAAEEIYPTIELAVRAVDQKRGREGAPDHAVELFIANVAIAAGARVQFREPELDWSEVKDAVDFFVGFMNSAWHFWPQG
ncbi:hypothetical protein [Streptomyces cellostaticus]|uniref:hypothetical protein n=1 Tax=Streptomyces cellostaticus TaxID=67285 RepID=UPI000AD9811C|nr:hypothetical protein [Streptomyces cellostaticus]GHI04613.1 hypothetical protein Scel_29340 [Streptomyces cellostaticus]